MLLVMRYDANSMRWCVLSTKRFTERDHRDPFGMKYDNVVLFFSLSIVIRSFGALCSVRHFVTISIKVFGTKRKKKEVGSSASAWTTWAVMRPKKFCLLDVWESPVC